MRRLAGMVILAIAMGASTIGCGGDDGVNLPFDDDTQVNELSSGDLQDLCEAGLEAARRAMGSTVCAVQGLAKAAAGEDSCEASQASCMGTMFAVAICQRSDTATIDCTATIGEIERCMNETLAIADLFPRITCSTSLADLASIDFEELEFSLPASCKSLEERCGNLNLGMGSLDDD